MASYRKWTPREPPLAPVETLDAIAAGRAHVRQAELQDKSAVAATRLQSMVRGRKQKSKYAQMLYDALLLKEGTSKASSSNSEADAQFRRWVLCWRFATKLKPHFYCTGAKLLKSLMKSYKPVEVLCSPSQRMQHLAACPFAELCLAKAARVNCTSAAFLPKRELTQPQQRAPGSPCPVFLVLSQLLQTQGVVLQQATHQLPRLAPRHPPRLLCRTTTPHAAACSPACDVSHPVPMSGPAWCSQQPTPPLQCPQAPHAPPTHRCHRACPRPLVVPPLLYRRWIDALGLLLAAPAARAEPLAPPPGQWGCAWVRAQCSAEKWPKETR